MEHGANGFCSTDVNFIASQALARQAAAAAGTNGEATKEKVDAMAALERQARAPQGFVAASTGPEGGKKTTEPAAAAAAATANPDAIDLDDEDL